MKFKRDKTIDIIAITMIVFYFLIFIFMLI